MNTMRAPLAAFFLKLVFLGILAQANNQFLLSSQAAVFLSANVGESVTLQCFYRTSYAIHWYKQSLGNTTTIISSLFDFNHDDHFHEEFRNNPRFRLETGSGKYHLMISNLTTSDSAFYYCLNWASATMEVSMFVFVSVKDSGFSFPLLKYQSAFGTDQPEDSVTLTCTVDTGSCSGEHNVYWVRDSEGSQPGLIYTQGGSNDQCKKKNNTQTHTCVYNLPMERLNLSHAGTYYCAVVACGHILFGERNKLDIKDELNLVYFWRGASVFSTILAVLLAFSLCMLTRGNTCQSSESQARRSTPSAANTKGHLAKHNLYYATSSLISQTQNDPTWSECVFHSVKL